MQKASNYASFSFIFSTALLCFISIFGIWGIFEGDVISKSMQSVGLLLLVTLVVIFADNFSGRGSEKTSDVEYDEFGNMVSAEPAVNPAIQSFQSIRQVTVSILITSVGLLAILGVMGIWEILNSDALGKSVASIAVLAFSSLIVIMLCLHREGSSVGRIKISGWTVLLFLIFGWWLLSILSSMFFY